ncbi:hypothetical protein ASZ90_012097 [hydrocarbon metagenome]|uniref:Uncharacterized protein n=1 Tax=hydrocarbon metagenome TaxID=938273 RepID=A0A0W8FC82_9ZZZZ
MFAHPSHPFDFFNSELSLDIAFGSCYFLDFRFGFPGGGPDREL